MYYKNYKNAFTPDSIIKSNTSKIKNAKAPYAENRLDTAANKSLQNDSTPSDRHFFKLSSYFEGAIREPPPAVMASNIAYLAKEFEFGNAL